MKLNPSAGHCLIKSWPPLKLPAGWIPFAEFMALALYAPGLGYYSGGAHKFGGAGDFVTGPEMTPLFGRTLAQHRCPHIGSQPPLSLKQVLVPANSRETCC